MGGSSLRGVFFRRATIIARPFDTKIITARVGIPHVYVVYLGILEQPLELGFDYAVGNIPLGDQSPPARVGVEGQAVRAHVDRKPAILRVALAIALMDENRPRQRKLFFPVKSVVREQYPAFCADGKHSQALAARSVTGSHLYVCWMTVARRQTRLADSICDSVSDSYYTI
jgi:hypothetical protein